MTSGLRRLQDIAKKGRWAFVFLLIGTGYQAVKSYNNLLYTTGDIRHDVNGAWLASMHMVGKCPAGSMDASWPSGCEHLFVFFSPVLPTFVARKGNLMKASERSLDFEPWCVNENRYCNLFHIISIFSDQEGTWRPSKVHRSSLLHFVLSPVRIILISFHSQGVCSVRWSDSGDPWHCLISSLYESMWDWLERMALLKSYGTKSLNGTKTKWEPGCKKSRISKIRTHVCGRAHFLEISRCTCLGRRRPLYWRGRGASANAAC